MPITSIPLKTTLVVTLLASAAAFAQVWSPPQAEPEDPPILRAPESDGRSAPPLTTPPATTPPMTEDGFDLMERGAALLLNEMMRQAEPHLNDMRRDFGQAIDTLGPLVGDLTRQIDDMRNYDTPERLPNGDIIIRRKAEAPPPPPPGETLRRFTIPRGTPKAAPPAPAPTPGPATPDPALPQIEL